jgi:hypothetical protein
MAYAFGASVHSQRSTATSAGSTSAAQTLTVTGLYPTTTAIAATGNPSGYDPRATVLGFANPPSLLSGTVSLSGH